MVLAQFLLVQLEYLFLELQVHQVFGLWQRGRPLPCRSESIPFDLRGRGRKRVRCSRMLTGVAPFISHHPVRMLGIIAIP